MGEKVNVTLSLPKSLVRNAEMVAVERGVLLSELIAELLVDLIDRQKQFAAARQKHLAILADGFDLGSGGSASWTRESLHDR